MRAILLVVLGSLFVTGAARAAVEDWQNYSVDDSCAVMTKADAEGRSLMFTFHWQRSSGKAPAFAIIDSGSLLEQSDFAVVQSPTLGAPWVLESGDRIVARGPNEKILRDDIAAGREWSVTLQLTQGNTIRFVPQADNSRVEMAMYEVCLKFPKRAPAPAATELRWRAQGMANISLGRRCSLEYIFRPPEGPVIVGLEVDDQGAQIRAGTLSETLNLQGFDLRALGGAARVSPSAGRTDTNRQGALAIAQEFAAGKERRVPLDVPGRPGLELVLGGPEFAIEAAMFQACLTNQ